MEEKEDNHPDKAQKKIYIPERYIWKRSYTLVLLANALYVIFFYFLMTYFR